VEVTVGETVTLAPVAEYEFGPVQVYPLLPETVNVTDPPTQMEGEFGLIVKVGTGVIPTEIVFEVALPHGPVTIA
jgi:hypothetical protein